MKLGLIDLDTSHPKSWVPILREMGHEVAAVFDGGTVYPEGYAAEFASEMGIPKVCRTVEELADEVDAAIIHCANWDLHLMRAKPLVRAGVPVLIDKPIIGNVRDARTLIRWAAKGKVIAGGSSLRHAYDIKERILDAGIRREEIHAAWTGCGVDEFNYGIHAFAQLVGILGAGVASVRWLGKHVQEQYELVWSDGRRGIVTVGETPKWLPSYATVVTASRVVQFEVDVKRIYRALLEHDLPILEGKSPPMDMRELLEPEFAAIAGLVSKSRGGKRVLLSKLSTRAPGYDGAAFGRKYQAQRLPKYLEARKNR